MVGRKRGGWKVGHYNPWTPSNSITTVLIQSLIHSLRTHLFILASQRPSGEGEGKRVSLGRKGRKGNGASLGSPHLPQTCQPRGVGPPEWI